jgi:hypothetical protein
MGLRCSRQTCESKKKRNSVGVALNPPKEEGGGDKPGNAGGATPAEEMIGSFMVQCINYLFIHALISSINLVSASIH